MLLLLLLLTMLLLGVTSFPLSGRTVVLLGGRRGELLQLWRLSGRRGHVGAPPRRVEGRGE